MQALLKKIWLSLFVTHFEQDPNIVLDKLNATEATFTKNDVLQEISKLGVDDYYVPEFLEKILQKSECIGNNENGENLYTGKKYKRIENAIFSKFDKLLKQKAKTICSTEVISNVLQKYSYINEEQKNAIIKICGKSNVNILIGRAGSGKTTVLKIIAEIYKNCGARVIGMCLSAIASENLGKIAKIESNSIAYWIYHKWAMDDESKLKPGDVIIIDESSMVGAADWKKILNAAARFGAKIIIVGDNHQFAPVAAGDCLRLFIERIHNFNSDQLFELKRIMRQKKKWMQSASIALSKLRIKNALTLYKNNDKILPAENILQVVAQKYLELEKTGRTIVLCYSKAECEQINNAIRIMKKANRTLGHETIKIGEKSFSINDKIIFLKNQRSLDVKNGQTAIIQSFNGNIVNVKTESNAQTTKSIDILDYDTIDHAYAITMHKSQGKTFDNTIIVASHRMDGKAFYVAMTRHKNDVFLFYKKDDFLSFDELIHSASKLNKKKSLNDLRIFDYRDI